MGIRASHVINAVEYLPYGTVTQSNLNQYSEWYKTLSIIQQMYWLAYVCDIIGRDLIQLIYKNTVFQNVYNILSHDNLIHKELGLYAYTIKMRYGDKKHEFNSKVLHKWVVYPLNDDKLGDLDGLIEYILKKSGISKPVEEVEYYINEEVDLKFILKHFLFIGSTPGYYDDYLMEREREGKYSDNLFVPLNPRQAFMDLHLTHII